MSRMYAVTTESKDGTPYGSYNVVANNFEDAVKKITKRELDLDLYPEHEERISEVKIIASEKMIYIFDIDGTLTDLTHRLHFVQGETKNWDAFYKACEDDGPIFETITVARALSSAGNVIVYSTGRSEDIRGLTISWLSKYRLPISTLYMRKSKDHREDYVVKSELYDQILLHFPKFVIGGVFEDRQQVVDMYRARGLRVFQVAKGDF